MRKSIWEFIKSILVFVIVIVMIFCLASCRTKRIITHDINVHEWTDTVYRTDTIRTEVVIPEECVEYIYDTIHTEVDVVSRDGVEVKLVTIAPWEAFTSRSYARAWVDKGVTHLTLRNYPDTIRGEDIIEHNDLIVHKDSIDVKYEIKEVRKALPFYKDNWFYIAIIILLLLIFSLYFNFRK